MKRKVDFAQFLSGISAKDYVFCDTSYEEQVRDAAKLFCKADAIVIGAGAGLSAAAGLTYGGKRFTDNFGEFIEKYGSMYMRDMYSSGFYPFPTEEAKWGYWSKHAYLNRIEPEALALYQAVYKLVKEKPHFVLTTNVDYQFWKAGFSDENIFATQGDYGKIQCKKGCHPKTYDAVDLFVQMNQVRKDCLIPSHMVPKCPVCGGDMAMHLRSDQYFVEDEHWNEAAGRYVSFIEEHGQDRVVLLELGVGFNTPTIIRFPFEQMVRANENWSLIRLNMEESFVPESFGKRAVGIGEDIAKSLHDIMSVIEKNMQTYSASGE
ncbi:MAG: Sir2 silent information regulator family NAD-dependent deacetylase [Lachnospiraceae bacterium]|nr:Sir2 silent information regulator family NAD-dependent deacetylase [Lachnospiraceae bacterium]